MLDFVYQGQAVGNVATVLLNNNFDHMALKPWIGQDGRTYVNKFAGINPETGAPVYNAVPVQNATATLRKDDWKVLDEAIIRVAKPRLRVFGDLRSRGLQYVIPNGMSKTVLEFETMSDITPATISMDGIRRGDNDRPVFELVNLPLPIIHKDFSFSARQVMASRNGGSPLDTTTAELAAMRVAEEVEKLTLGVRDEYKYAGGYVYGYTNFPSRLTKTFTHPNAVGFTPALHVQEVLQMKQQSMDANHRGPWMLYYSSAWDPVLDDDYSANKGDLTLRERLRRIDGIEDVVTADHLTGYQNLLVQMTSNVARAVVGMDMTTVQWESHGGMQLNFKVMCILLPQLRADQNDQTGIVHGTATLPTTTTTTTT